ncbi:MAG TPA: SigE family RNA polymerase sigma factor [Nocardioides sp.]|nr:SigE family RNA polymerase sigma factor [Nocardioides sp.]
MTGTMTDEQFCEFVRAAWPGLYRTAYLILGDHQLAEDLVQTSLAKTYASWSKVKEPAAATAYARVVLANTAASWFRRRGWRNEQPVEDLPETGVDVDPTTRTLVVDALATLAPRQRAVVVLRYYDDLSVREVAHALGISEGTVKSQTSDALARLRDVLADEAGSVQVPPADADLVLGRGRRIRRDRRVRVAAATTAIVAVVAVVLVAVTSGGRDRADEIPPVDADHDRGWAVASGSEVQLGSGSVVDLGEGPAGYVFYTSAGVLVNIGLADAPWGATPRWVLVRPDGTTTDFRLDVGDQLVGTDPDQPYLVYVEATDSPTEWDVVVRDLRSNRVADTVSVDGPATWTGNATPDASLVGDHVYLNLDSTAVDVDLTTRQVTPSDTLPAGQPLVIEGEHAIVVSGEMGDHAEVVDVDTGESLMEYSQGDRYLRLSPDGRYVAALPRRVCDDSGSCAFDLPTGYVHDLDTGRSVEVDVEGSTVAWTRNGGLLRVTEKEVSVCDPGTGACNSTPLEVAPDDPVLGDTVNW